MITGTTHTSLPMPPSLVRRHPTPLTRYTTHNCQLWHSTKQVPPTPLPFSARLLTPCCCRVPRSSSLASLLIKPVQRVLKYPLLLREMVGATPPGHPALAILTNA